MENPNYYSILPAKIRYDKHLKPMEKLLYSEITALTNKSGYCHASNRYFAELYDVSQVSVSRWINHIAKCGYLKIIINRNENNQIVSRKIFINDSQKPINKNDATPINNSVNSYKQNSADPINKNVKENITSNNITSINKDIVGLTPDNDSEPHEEPSEKPDKIPYKKIIDYLNEQLGTKYRSSSAKTRSLIKARWSEGFTLDDFKQVITNKNNEWGNDLQMSKYLRPETLFGTKFEAYLNQRAVAPNKDRPNQLGW